MGYKLQSGDQVTVLTQKNQRPNEAWLKWVVTGKARDKIRLSMREDERKQAEFGKEALQRKLDHLKVDYETSVEMLVKHFNFRTRQEFYAAITNEAVDLQEDLKVFKIEKGKLVLIEEKEIIYTGKTPTENIDAKKAGKLDSKTELFVNGERASQYEYAFAECCKPVQGDDVFAYVTANNIMKIHRTNCKNADNLMTFYGYRILTAEWGAKTNASFVAELLITGIDSGVGMIERLSNKISSQIGLDIRSFSIEGNEGYFEGRVRVVVANLGQLMLAMKDIKGLVGVSNVTRVD